MTILPKKKHQESRKNDQDHDSDRGHTRHRNRTRDSRSARTQQQHTTEDLNPDTTSVFNLSSTTYNDIDSQDGNMLPNKRSRHNRDRQQSSFYHTSTSTSNNISRRNSRDGNKSPGNSNEDDPEDGYNSSDEHGPREHSKGLLSDESLLERETEFEQQLLQKKGFTIKQMATDGACMFRAVADQVYGDQEMHSIVRKHCMDYMVKNRDFFSPYITEDFTSYIRRKRNDHSHGNHIEMQALSEMYNRPIEVYQYSCVPINTFHGRSYNTDETPPIRLSYHGNVHYNSIIDPYNPTVGVGLGLAGYKPGTEEETLLKSATKESESLLLEEAMLEDKIKATDWEATDEHLAEIAARESYLQWLKERQKQPASSGASSSKCTSTKSRRSPPREDTFHRSSSREDHRTSSPSTKDTRSPAHHTTSSHEPCERLTEQMNNPPCNTSSHRKSPRSTNNETTATSNDWAFAFGYDDSEWESDPVLAAVLAQSQEEYLKSLSKNNKTSSDSRDCGSSSKS